jgi:para-aminobenzoate synthetase component 1
MRVLPLLKTIEIAPDVVEIYEKLKALPFGFVLDSSMHVEGMTGYSFVSAWPFLVFRSRGEDIDLLRSNPEHPEDYSTENRRGNPFEYLKKLLAEYRISIQDKAVPLIGGAVGYFAYDLGRQIEWMPDLAKDDVKLPDCCLGFYDLAVAVDHKAGSVYIVSSGLPQKGPQALPRAEERLCFLEKILAGANISDRIAGKSGDYTAVSTAGSGRSGGAVKGWGAGREDYYALMEKTPDSLLHTDFDRDGYCAVVEKAREYIAAGDIFQVNISQRFSLPARKDPWQVYKKLREINPAPMAAFLDFGGQVVVSASPERFLSVKGDLVETRPIKGTRPRGGDPAEDRYWRNELWNSAKDRAELVMIVDLERNDLGRVCRVGSVKVPELYRVEEYATVFHLVSTVVGELERGKDLVDLLLAAFPGGSITGAPKIRAMEIIEELEPVRRGIYCGSIGYLGFDGDADLNIVIRTLVFSGGKIYFQVGGGITIDSDPEAEYLETLDKARALVRALGLEEG